MFPKLAWCLAALMLSAGSAHADVPNDDANEPKEEKKSGGDDCAFAAPIAPDGDASAGLVVLALAGLAARKRSAGRRGIGPG